MTIYDPPLKIQGKKTSMIPAMAQAMGDTLARLDDTRGTWIEPFMGSGVVGFNLADGRPALFADINPHGVNLYKRIQSGEISPTMIRDNLTQQGAALLAQGGVYYYMVRDRFNATADPLDFLFLSRACYNGVLRFNSSGEFNTPFCRNPGKFTPTLIGTITAQADGLATRCRANDWVFVVADYTAVIGAALPGDFIYCDPPYVNSENTYYQAWGQGDHDRLLARLGKSGAAFCISMWHSKPDKPNAAAVKMASHYREELIPHRYIVGPKAINRSAALEGLYFGN